MTTYKKGDSPTFSAKKVTVPFVCAFLILCCTTAQAHHSWTVGYDGDTWVELEGVVTEVWFASPHARIYIEVTNEAGDTEVWEGETWPASVLIRRGWTYGKINVGDTVILKGERAKGGRNGLHLQSIARPSDGWEAWIGLGTPENPTLGN